MAVKSFRRARSLGYQYQRLEREHREVGKNLDATRLKRLQVFIEGPRKRRRTIVRGHDAALDILRPQFQAHTMLLDELAKQHSHAKVESRKMADQVYELEAQATNEVFRPSGVLHLPPRLYKMLRVAKAAAWLLEDDRLMQQETEDKIERSRSALRNAITLVKYHIGIAECGTQDNDAGLVAAMADLRSQVDDHRAFLRDEEYAKAKMERRELEQRYVEEDLFLDVVGPVLEADGQVEKDVLRTSLVDFDQNGERLVFRCVATGRLTEAQSDRYIDEIAAFPAILDKYQAMVAGIKAVRDTQWRTFWIANPNAEEGPFDERFDEDMMVAAELLAEAKCHLAELHYFIQDVTGDVAFEGQEVDHNFVDEDMDGAAQSEAPSRQAARPALVDPLAIQQWQEETQRPDPKRELESVIDAWPWRPVDMNDEGAFESYYLPYEERPLREKLIPVSRRWTEDTRSGMALLRQDPDSQERLWQQIRRILMTMLRVPRSGE
ncbi:hypothetical protein LTR27_001549 [Elasticomyces elasticus]|nr:hypothetical protein LTR27_001549 [Elasticomyces elasticus]